MAVPEISKAKGVHGYDPASDRAKPIEAEQNSSGQWALQVIAEIQGAVVENSISEANDSIVIYGKQDGTGTNRAVNTDAAGRVRTDSTIQIADLDVSNANPVPVSDAGASLTVDALDLDIRNLTFAADKVDASGSTLGANSGIDIGDVTVNNASGASAVNIQDGGNSLTVDATDLDIRNLTHVASQDSVRVGDGTDLALVTTAGELNVLASAQPGVDIGDVTINNGAGASAVNIQDGGNSITVDNAALSVVGGGTEATAQRVTIANDSTGVLSVDDNGGTLTVDQGAGVTSNPWAVQGQAADGSTIAAGGNPVVIAGQDTTNIQSIRTDTTGHLGTWPKTAALAEVDGVPNTRDYAVTEGGAASVNQRSVIHWFNGTTWDRPRGDTSGVFSQGSAAHDAAVAGNPVRQGLRAIDHGTNPTAVAAADTTDWYANRAGVPFVIGGHPNVRSTEYRWDTAQTNDDMLGAIAAGTKVVVTALHLTLDEATTVGVKARVGFGAASVPAEPADGASVEGIIFTHSGTVPGTGLPRGDGSGILGIGADDQELRITAEAPTTGSARMLITWYTVPA